MKKFTNLFNLLAITVLLGIGSNVKAQCNANFIWSNWANGVVGFTSTSTNATSVTTYYWNFGNGNTYSATGNPGMGASQTYTANGTYTVTLFIFSAAPSCSSGITQTISVNNATTSSGCGLTAGCSNFLGGPGTMNFINNTTGTVSATTYTWNYGDGGTSNGLSGSHTYTANGNYTVTLTASNNSTPACVSTVTIPVTITTVCNLVASYSFTQGVNGLVNFVSTSTGTSSGYVYLWNFGDGGTGSGASVAHTYTNNTYTAILTVKNSSVAATCTSSSSQTLTVTSNTCTLASGFTFTQGSSGLVNFSNASTGTNSNTTYSWNFGNGSSSGSSGSPSSTYINGGIHTVKLTLTDSSSPTCSSVATQTLNITSVSCTANSNFTLVYGGSPGYWNATPAYPWNVVNAKWSWGDSFVSSGMYPSHTYSVTGNYNICLSVTVSCGATASTCSTYSIYKSAGVLIYHVNVIEPVLKSVDNLAGLSEKHNSTFAVSVYPNPTSREFALMAQGIEGNNVKVSVMDALGREVVSYTNKANDGKLMEVIDFGNQPAGVYFVNLQSGNQSVTRKVVLTK